MAKSTGKKFLAAGQIKSSVYKVTFKSGVMMATVNITAREQMQKFGKLMYENSTIHLGRKYQRFESLNALLDSIKNSGFKIDMSNRHSKDASQ